MVSKILGVAIIFCGLGLIFGYMWWEYNRPAVAYFETPPAQLQDSMLGANQDGLVVDGQSIESLVPASTAENQEPPDLQEYVGDLIVTNQRTMYQDGQLQLYIPKLQLHVPVQNGVTAEILKNGVGLFDYSQLPGPPEYNANVSIAGCRDDYQMEFADIDQLTGGDLIYLYYGNRKYTYEYEATIITDQMDWDPVRVKEYPCVTLQSTMPQDSGDDRIFVTGRLIEEALGVCFPK